MTVQELLAAGYEIVCGSIQKDGKVHGYVGEAPVWHEGCEPVAAPTRKTRAKKAEVEEEADVPPHEVEDDLSDLLSE